MLHQQTVIQQARGNRLGFLSYQRAPGYCSFSCYLTKSFCLSYAQRRLARRSGEASVRSHLRISLHLHLDQRRGEWKPTQLPKLSSPASEGRPGGAPALSLLWREVERATPFLKKQTWSQRLLLFLKSQTRCQRLLLLMRNL